ncbi:PUB and ZnF_RBZ domain-containing protein tamozhennic [Haematobia irritans]|uniref:PUB and ZnF_RBZ domain-containing protein tamozhennic n=1 Tax=Haematobia irritans TaxID=7368 RepID=UPI003F508D46
MSDFLPRDILPDLWDEILKLHWTYLETEESIQKLEERKKLEGCLKELLCMVQHDRKFFLPETALVLKNSIRELSDFNGQKAISAFEAISQYANNLFTKPWRKEFRILKTYSGFYQHEIKTNLADAEKLFEAMGYRRLSDDTLILDGPICPDQVTNVSRDAMTAYVELQIMKNVYMALDANGMTTSWLDIFRYRENHIGGISQAIKDLIYANEEKRFRAREKALAGGDNYGYIDVQGPTNVGSSRPSQCQCGNMQYQIPQPPRQRMTNGPCCSHEFQQHQQRNHPVFSNINYSNSNYHHHHPPVMASGGVSVGYLPHSRSLEHYGEPSNMHQHSMLPHRHSFDHQQQGCSSHMPHTSYGQQQRLHNSMQQQHQFYRNPAQHFYESPYDCIDENSLGGSSISYAAVAASSTGGGADMAGSSAMNYNINGATYAKPYNVSGNRFPLPYSISNQLSAPHSGLENSYVPDNPLYSQVSKMAPQGYVMNQTSGTMGGGSGYAPHPQHKPVSVALQNSAVPKSIGQRQQHYLSEHLIDFEDPSIIPPPPADQFDPYHQNYNHDISKTKRTNRISESEVPGNYQPRDLNYDHGHPDMYVYAKPIPKENRQTQKSLQNSMNKSSYGRKISAASSSERETGDTTDFNYESANDDFTMIPRHHRQHSPTQFSKNQDGVGSYESWNYVFQNLERTSYTKDLGDREDLLVKSLDLDSMNITSDAATASQMNTGEKRRSYYRETDNNSTVQNLQQNTKQKNSRGTSPPPTSNSNNTKQKAQLDNKQKLKSSLKQPPTLSTSNNAKHQVNSNRKPTNFPKTNDNKPNKPNMENNNSLAGSSNKPNKKSASYPSTQTTAKIRPPEVSMTPATPPAVTEHIVTGKNEWSCRSCTFINPDTVRICEMCCRTKDNNLNAPSSTGSKSTQSVNHTAPTCV